MNSLPQISSGILERLGGIPANMQQAQQTIGQMQDASEVARLGTDLLTKFNTASRLNTPEGNKSMMDIGDQILKDPKLSDHWDTVRHLTEIMKTHGSQIAPPAAAKALPPILSAASMLPIGALAGVSVIPQSVLDQFYTHINPQARMSRI